LLGLLLSRNESLFHEVDYCTPNLSKFRALSSAYISLLYITTTTTTTTTTTNYYYYYAANVVGKDLDIFALGAVSLNYIYAPNCK
jgi:hypothetical protein